MNTNNTVGCEIAKLVWEKGFKPPYFVTLNVKLNSLT